MATAREQLYEEVIALFKQAPGDDALDVIGQIMIRYRVQTKPGYKPDPGTTARDTLGVRIRDIWASGDDDREATLSTEIDKFRMQSKAKSARAKKPAAKKAAAPARKADPIPVMAPPPMMQKPKPEPIDPRQPQPVAGGPRRKGKSRSECPKCHSMGVVLARSYAGDEYFSCIYCGWQAYKPADDLTSPAALAGRLLGRQTNDS